MTERVLEFEIMCPEGKRNFFSVKSVALLQAVQPIKLTVLRPSFHLKFEDGREQFCTQDKFMHMFPELSQFFEHFNVTELKCQLGGMVITKLRDEEGFAMELWAEKQIEIEMRKGDAEYANSNRS